MKARGILFFNIFHIVDFSNQFMLLVLVQKTLVVLSRDLFYNIKIFMRRSSRAKGSYFLTSFKNFQIIVFQIQILGGFHELKNRYQRNKNFTTITLLRNLENYVDHNMNASVVNYLLQLMFSIVIGPCLHWKIEPNKTKSKVFSLERLCPQSIISCFGRNDPVTVWIF